MAIKTGGFEIFLVTFGHFLQNGHWIYQFICYKMPPKYYPITINFIILLLPPILLHTWQKTLGVLSGLGEKNHSRWLVSLWEKTLWALYPRDYVYNSVTNITHSEKWSSWSLFSRKKTQYITSAITNLCLFKCFQCLRNTYDHADIYITTLRT